MDAICILLVMKQTLFTLKTHTVYLKFLVVKSQFVSVRRSKLKLKQVQSAQTTAILAEGHLFLKHAF